MRTVHVVSQVYWNGPEQGGGGFDWYDSLEDAVRGFYAERDAWRGTSSRIRLVTVDDVPLALTNEGVTDYLDRRIDDLEVHLPARKVALIREEDR